MAGKTPALAVRAFTAPIQRAVSCFATCKVTCDSYDPATEGVLTINNGRTIDLYRHRGGSVISLEATMRYRIVEDATPGRGPWKVSTTGWIYGVLSDWEPIVDFHWHPISDSHVVVPHVHVRASSSLRKHHIPTGRVLIEDVLTFADEIGARGNTGWERIMRRNRDKFRLGATWGALLA